MAPSHSRTVSGPIGESKPISAAPGSDMVERNCEPGGLRDWQRTGHRAADISGGRGAAPIAADRLYLAMGRMTIGQRACGGQGGENEVRERAGAHFLQQQAR